MNVVPAPPQQSFSDELFERLGPAVDALGRRRTAQHWDPADTGLLRRWFLLIWQSVQASVPLMELASDQLRQFPRTSFTDLLGEYFTLHALEEQGHDEWLLEDLAGLGVDEHSARLELPNRHIAAMVGSQYYLIRHYHPALLLGYIAFCEGHPPRPEAIDGLRLRSATSPDVWRTYRFHASEDPIHLEELRAVLDQVPAEPEAMRQAIVVNGLRCVTTYADAIDSLFPLGPLSAERLLPKGTLR
jgi:hypothetical protein